MFKKILLSIVIIATAGTTAVLGTQALADDTAVLGASTYSTNSVNLKISKTGAPGSFAESVDGFDTNLKLSPGKSVTQTVYLKNESEADALKISAQATNVAGTIDAGDVKIKFVKSGTATETTNSALSTWANSLKALGTDFNLPIGATQQYDIVISLDSTAVQGDFTFGFNFKGENVAP